MLKRRGGGGAGGSRELSLPTERAEEPRQVRALPDVRVRAHTRAARCVRARRMMTMNGKQHFSMHPALHEPKYPGLHSGAEGMRRVCLPAPQVRGGQGCVCGGERRGHQPPEKVCKVDLTGLCSIHCLPPLSPSAVCVLPPHHLLLLLSSTCLFMQCSCFHINFYDLRFEEGSLLSSALLAFGKCFLDPESCLTEFPTDSSMRTLACSCRAIYSEALMRACWRGLRLWQLLTALSLTARVTRSNQT